MQAKHLTGIHELSIADVQEVLALSRAIKSRRSATARRWPASRWRYLRQAIDAHARLVPGGDRAARRSGAGARRQRAAARRGETVEDTAGVLSRYVDGIMARVFSHDDIVKLAANATVPVINGLSDLLHPCQAFAGLLHDAGALRRAARLEGDLRRRRNNVAHSLANGAAKLACTLTISTPGEKYAPQEEIIAAARKAGKATDAKISLVQDPAKAVRGARVVYTGRLDLDGPRAGGAAAPRRPRAYQRQRALFARAARTRSSCTACPPTAARRSPTRSPTHPRSVIFDQAENRLHTQKAIMVLLMS